jgi:hypothetical protein
MTKKLITNDLGRFNHDLMEILSWHLTVETGENHKELQPG